MQRAERQKTNIQIQPTTRQRSDMEVASPQGEHISQLESRVKLSPQVTQQSAMAEKMNTGPNQSLQRKLAAMIHDSPRQTVQRKFGEHEVAQQKSKTPSSTKPIQRKWIDNGGSNLIWDSLIDGVQWYYEINSKKMFYAHEGFISEKKDREEWVKEYGSDPLGDKDGSVISVDELVPDLGPAGDLMSQLEERYETETTWEDGSGPDRMKKKIVLIESFVKLENGSRESVYKNEMDVNTNKFYAAWNQRTRDTEVGPKKTKAMFNSDLLTCHRHLAMAFAKSEGAEVNDNKDVFTVVRKNVNNGDWQIIYDGLPVMLRGKLMGLKISESAPCALKGPFVYKGLDGKTNTANSMWDIFKLMVPNTKAVFAMVEQRYPEYYISSWEYGGGCLTATVVKK